MTWLTGILIYLAIGACLAAYFAFMIHAMLENEHRLKPHLKKFLGEAEEEAAQTPGHMMGMLFGLTLLWLPALLAVAVFKWKAPR